MARVGSARAAGALGEPGTTPLSQPHWKVIPIEPIEHAEIELLKLGVDAEVLAPRVLRQRIAATVETLTPIYRPR